jgi:cytochrome d ubiquinol oxidase subunit II
MKTEGELQARMCDYAKWLGIATLGFIGVVSILTPFQDPAYFQRWFTRPNSIFNVLVPALVGLCTWLLFMGLKQNKEAQPFLASLGLFVLSFIGILVSFYPNIVPPSLTIAEAAAPDSSLKFTLVGTMVLVPLILIYTAYTYWVFRGKVKPEGGYH